MTTAVTAPLERQFGEMPGLTQMSSISSAGASVTTLQFALDMSLDVAEQEVQAAINAATEPASGRSARPAGLRQGQPRQRPGPDACGDVEDAAADPGRGSGGRPHRPEDLAGLRRRTGVDRRRPAAGAEGPD